jgi:hypothetical protein
LAASVINPSGAVILFVELIALPLAFAVVELTTVATFELVELAFEATALILALVFAFDPRVLESSVEQLADPKTVKLNKIVADKIFISTPYCLLKLNVEPNFSN